MAITIIAGEDRVLNFRMTDVFGAPIDLTSETALVARLANADGSILNVPNSDFTVINAVQGSFKFSISAANTALLLTDTAAQDFTLEVTFPSGKRVFNVLQSLIINAPSVSLT